MTALLAFAGVLLVAVLVSERAHRTVLSTAVVFLVAGFLLGDEVLGAVDLGSGDEPVGVVAELALFAVLFTDGMKVGVRELRTAWRLPGRALLVGLPLTIVVIAVFGRFVAGLPWAEAFLIGAALSPTDPVFASAIVGRDEVPRRLRHLLNVESGLNDGLALPIVLVLLSVITDEGADATSLAGEVLLGVALGVAIPWLAIRLERSRFLSASTPYEPLNALAIGLLVLAAASLTHANEFLAAFAAGVTVATMSPAVRDAFHRFGDLLAELLKLGALMLFGALISPSFLREIPLSGYLFALLVLVAARPMALAVSFARSGLTRKEWYAAAWFGPKGFASVVYGIIILEAGTGRSDELFHLIALAVVASILAHSSTDVLVARRFAEPPPAGPTARARPVTLAPDDAVDQAVGALSACADAAAACATGWEASDDEARAHGAHLARDCAELCRVTEHVLSTPDDLHDDVALPLLRACVAACHGTAVALDAADRPAGPCAGTADACRHAEDACLSLLGALR
ncbi:sodium:proton antiporter [Iamia sp. SCSIO 61187]|nr:cation:proton antiporter [Iamia sp. SCSIO 61187]QYG94125.1 sodium:proton antiporter [Iamia sp. SCSIO 61187]